MMAKSMGLFQTILLAANWEPSLKQGPVISGISKFHKCYISVYLKNVHLDLEGTSGSISSLNLTQVTYIICASIIAYIRIFSVYVHTHTYRYINRYWHVAAALCIHPNIFLIVQFLVKDNVCISILFRNASSPLTIFKLKK